MITVHVLDVGQGNMVVVLLGDGSTLVYDCNITQENKSRVFGYLKKIMPKRSVDVFVNSHRDADHMRGIWDLHDEYPISELWDSGVSANTETSEYDQYMRFRQVVPYCETVTGGREWTKRAQVQILSGNGYGKDPNSQSIVLKINGGASMILGGDSDGTSWRDYIVPRHRPMLKAEVLLASHHGSKTFFETAGSNYMYDEHINMILPICVIVSVGSNPHGHPDPTAISEYSRYASGLDNGLNVLRTDVQGNISVELYDDRHIRVGLGA